MKHYFQALVIVPLISFILAISALAQPEEEITLNLSRDFGYSSGTGRIQGTFTMSVSGPDDLTRVEFLIDDDIIAEIVEPPFRYQFNTDTYSVGIHTLMAVGYTPDGSPLVSNERRVEFVSAQEGPQAALKFILPILVLVIGISLLSILLPALFGRGKKGTVPLGSPRTYGVSGGAICPNCKRPFSRNVFGLNLLVGKLDRCPHCGHWSIVRAASPQELRQAELAELEQNNQAGETLQISEEDRLRKELDDSKFQDL